ncbi:uncharacterized protein LOC107483651 [Arachis duranensis]|uniref:Uncharacterized protein LOC107483651 n=1 Tax=Arachis duranensis TaxID=130453 RepID=A0A6P4D1Z3_ARADU|nr:uncharacterized protein LOC107483651 [Arachis duranensis]
MTMGPAVDVNDHGCQDLQVLVEREGDRADHGDYSMQHQEKETNVTWVGDEDDVVGPETLVTADLQLVNLPLNDRKFTWFRGRSCSPIDRVLVSIEWLEEFPDTRLKGDIEFTNKLKALTVPLKRWHRDNFGDMDNMINKFEEEIKKLDDMVSAGTYDGTVEAQREALVSCCAKWYVIKEIHWKQLSRSQHTRDMDKNARYFHNLASSRRRNNRIDALLINGSLVQNQARIKVAIRGFYNELYRQEYAPMIRFRDGLVKQIDEDKVVASEVLSSTEKIKEAVLDCESTKAPGSDGYNMNFIKKR